MNLTQEAIDDYIDYVLDSQNIYTPQIEDYDEHSPYFEEMKRYKQRRDMLAREIQDGRIKLDF